MFSGKTKLNSLTNTLKQNASKAHKYSSLNASNIEYFEIFASK